MKDKKTNDEELRKERLKNIQQILLTYRSDNSNYSYHKETMAWSATVIYVGGIIGLISFILAHNFTGSYIIIFDVLIILFFGLTIPFIYQQFRARSIAADRVVACDRLIFELNNPNFSIDEKEMKFDDKKEYPKFLKNYIKEANEKNRGGRNSLQSFKLYFKWLLFDLLLHKEKVQISMREIFECSKYLIIFTLTLIGLLIPWLKIWNLLPT